MATCWILTPNDYREAYRAMVDLLERHGHLALVAETGQRRYRTGGYPLALHVGAPPGSQAF